MQKLNNLYMDGLRTEIAILQEDVQSKNPGYAKFIIPVLMTTTNVDSLIINSKNSSINLTNTINLYIPTQHTYFYNKDIVPKGTKFIVTFVGGNINDIKIIGMYYV